MQERAAFTSINSIFGREVWGFGKNEIKQCPIKEFLAMNAVHVYSEQKLR
jgi:tRNA C32,U32 (ribose-2'-O)-methylase TrmJ